MTEPTYRMPAEREAQAGTWLAWPHERGDWPGKFGPIRWVYAEIIRTLTRHQPVFLIVRDAKHQNEAGKFLKAAATDLSAVHFVECDTDRSWMRDAGPIFILDDQGKKVALDWRFNAWAKYDNWTKDDLIPATCAAERGLPCIQPMHAGRRVVLEGGSIDVNGAGLLLTTEECLLSDVQERNPGFSRGDYEAVFKQYLGIEKTIWLHKGIVGDDTHGHIDDIARFVNPTTILAVLETNEADENFALLRENHERLQSATNRQAKPLTIRTLPMPAPVVFRRTRLPASYANFLIANGVVIVPTFNDAKDREALGVIADCFPDREVVGIHCGDLIWGLGTLHCMTQQEPE